MAAALPLAIFGAGAFFAVPAINKAFTPDLSAPEDEDMLRRANMENMEEMGTVASAWHKLVNKQFLMGHPVSDVDGINHEAAATGYDPKSSENPLSHINRQYEELYTFDRKDTQLGLWTQQGMVRPARRVGINTALSEELYHPNDPSRRTAFLATTYVPNYAHTAQIQQAQRVAASDDPERSLRRQQGVEYYLRAPFQSFRYSE